jgi:hypothetical protein
MRLTIIPEDKFISIDGKNLLDIQQDFSWIPKDINAVQWYGDHGFVEYIDLRENLKIEELGIYENAIEIYNLEIKRIEEEELEFEKSIDYMERLRDIRDELLSATDWTQLLDSDISEEDRELWKIYRQQLRDLPENIDDPKPLVLDENHPDWPIPPISSISINITSD